MFKRLLSVTAAVISVILCAVLCACSTVTEYDGLETLTPTAESIIRRENATYYAHPDSVLTADGRILTFYVKGHGRGALRLAESTDNGKTWKQIENTPKSWETSQETPTIYRLKFTDGSEKMILICGRPGWNNSKGGEGWDTSVSTDDGYTWTEFKNTFWNELYRSDMDIAFSTGIDAAKNANACIVAMASLTQVKENGVFIDKWMALYHDYSFNNYKTYLTFDEAGEPVWSQPVRLFSDDIRELEAAENFCEIEIVRSPDGNELMLLIRANKKRTGGYITVSNDEGQTWSTPQRLPDFIAGERYKAEYEPTTGKLLVSYRETRQKRKNVYRANDWCGWYGDYSVLRSYADDDPSNDVVGGYHVLFAEDFGKGDCGYSGVVPIGEGKFICTSYGKFDKKAANPYILSVEFTVPDFN